MRHLMKKGFVFAIACFLLVSRIYPASATFVSAPSLTRVSAGEWTLSFTLNTAADVAVSIINLADSTVVRHLAAGVMGANAPAPFTRNSLSQTLSWDGRDDYGKPVTVADANLRARVRAGMTTQLVGLYGGNPYTIGATCNRYNTYVHGIVCSPGGRVYIAGNPANMQNEHWGGNFVTVREFDKDGNYIKTVFPPPSNLPISQVEGWGIVKWPDNTYSMKNQNNSQPFMTTTILAGTAGNAPNSTPGGSALQYIDGNGNLVWGADHILSFKTDGTIGTGTAKPLLLNPAPMGTASDPYRYLFGYCVLTPFRNGKLLMSGLYHSPASVPPTVVPDTNFYRDGKVFLVDPTTGTVTTWTSVDSVPQLPADRVTKLGGGYYYSTLQGTAVDSSGHVYVCDRLHGRIGVYDAVTAAYVGGLPLKHAHRVAVCGRTGVVYAVSQSQAAWNGSNNNVVKLFKFAPFAQGGAPVCSLSLASGSFGQSGLSSYTSIAVNDADGQTVVWVGVGSFITQNGVRLYRDDGSALTLVRDLGKEGREQNILGPENPTPDRLVVDRRTENLYVSNSWYALYQMSNWDNPTCVPCSTTAKKRIYALDCAISNDNLLYTFEGLNNYNPPITRYSLDRLHAPVNWPNTANNVLVATTPGRYAPCTGVRGMAVAPDNRVAVMANFIDRGTYAVSIFPDSGGNTAPGKYQVAPISFRSGGVKYDLKGNLYIGAGLRTPSFVIPDFFQKDTGYLWGVGSVLKFNGTDSGAIVPSSGIATAAVNAAKIYDNLPFAPFSADRWGGCYCRSPRFEVDPYGRLFVPNAVSCQVTVSDNDGNIINRFGRYGNIDSRGSLPGLPGQQVVAGTEIPMAWPTSVAASEDYVYVSDYLNCRIVRARMVYAADNFPDLTAGASREQEDAYWRAPLFTLSSGPVPFSGNTTVSLSLPGRSRVNLSVHDAAGRLIRTLMNGDCAPGLHRFAWNGRDAHGAMLAAGLYLYRLTADGRVLTGRTVLAR